MITSVLIGIIVVCILVIIARPRWYLKVKACICKPKFYYLDDFPEMQPFHDAFEDIRRECLAVTTKVNYDKPRSQRVWAGDHKDEAQEYLTKNKDMHGWMSAWAPGTDDGNSRWMNFPLLALGHEFKNNLAECPILAKLLHEHQDHINIAGFSKLMPYADIDPHVDSTGMLWGTMAYHLGLVVPEKNKCVLDVDGDKIYHGEGESFLFESTYRHSAANNTYGDRIILYIEVKV